MLGRFRGMYRRHSAGGPKPAILLYHRVAKPDLDPWALAVSPAHFADQLAWLRRHRRPLSLAELVSRLERGDLPAEAVALTFDDGYADNLHVALPALALQDMTATLFLTTGQHANPVPFWWDELASLVLLCEAVDARVSIGGRNHFLRWDEMPRKDRRDWRAWEATRDPQEETYVALWAALQRLSRADREHAMQQLRDLLGPVDGSADAPMTREELTRIVASGIFDIGGHTISHPALTALPPADRRHEIADNRRECEAICGRPVLGFAYPYGDLNDEVRSDVVAAGFAWACSTRNDVIRSSMEDHFTLPRIAVGDWSGQELQNVLTTA